MKIKIGFGPLVLTFDVDFVEPEGPMFDPGVQQAVNAANRADQAASRAEAALAQIGGIVGKP